MKKEKLLSLITVFMIFSIGKGCISKAESINYKNQEIVENSTTENLTPRDIYGWPKTNQELNISNLFVLYKARVDGITQNVLTYISKMSKNSTTLSFPIEEENGKNKLIGYYNDDSRTFIPSSEFFKNDEEVKLNSQPIGFDVFIKVQKNNELQKKYDKIEEKQITTDELASFIFYIEEVTGISWYTGNAIELVSVDEDIPIIENNRLIEKNKPSFTICGNSLLDNVYDYNEVLDLKVVLRYTKKLSKTTGEDREVFTDRVLGFLPGNEWDINFLKDINCKFRENEVVNIERFLSLGIADYAIKAFRDAEVKIDGVEYYDVEKLRIAYSQIPEENRISYGWYEDWAKTAWRVEGPVSLEAGEDAVYTARMEASGEDVPIASWILADGSAAELAEGGVLRAGYPKKESGIALRAIPADPGLAERSKEIRVGAASKAASVSILLNGEAIGKRVIGMNLSAGETALRLSALTEPANAHPAVKWQSSKSKVAEVDETGLVTARQAGQAVITATALDGSGKKATVKLNVTAPVTGIRLSGPDELTAGEKAQLEAEALPEYARNKRLRWTSSDKRIASVDGQGRVTAKKVSEAAEVTITATAGDGSGVSAEHKIKVVPKGE